MFRDVLVADLAAARAVGGAQDGGLVTLALVVAPRGAAALPGANITPITPVWISSGMWLKMYSARLSWKCPSVLFT